MSALMFQSSNCVKYYLQQSDQAVFVDNGFITTFMLFIACFSIFLSSYWVTNTSNVVIKFYYCLAAL